MGHTCIIGAGIIGTATAYFLSQSSKDKITIIESSSRPFASASGFAGGFLAKDWFAPSVASVGALSFDLHKKLAEENNGGQKWGYSLSPALSLAVDEGKGIGSGQRGEDWLMDGTSRSTVASKDQTVDFLNDDGSPAWLTKQKGGSLETIGGKNTAGQVEPLQLCEFLLDAAKSRGVQLLCSTEAVSLVSPNGVLESINVVSSSDTEAQLPCTTLIITAGAWTPRVFSTLFPKAPKKIPITPLAGHHIVVKSPRHASFHEKGYGGTHAVFAAPNSNISFGAEFFSRVAGEIYFAGLNDAKKPLPALATDSANLIETDSIDKLRTAAVRMLGLADGEGKEAIDDLEVIREAVCFRPVAAGGKPIITKLADSELGQGIRTSDNGGVFMGAGHGPWGITLSLGTGKVMAEMAMHQPTSADIRGLGLRGRS